MADITVYVFCAADVRRGSTKQLAAAAGEGVTALRIIPEHMSGHCHLALTSVPA